MSVSIKEVLDAARDTSWSRHVLLKQLRTRTFTTETQIQIITYICENYNLRVSPRRDFEQNPILDDQIIACMDSWTVAWTYVINSGAGRYPGYCQELVNLQTLCT